MQKLYVDTKVKEINWDVRQSFDQAYENWQRDCGKLLSIFSNPYQCAQLESIEVLKSLGKETIPLYIQKLSHASPLIFALIPYREIQDSELLVQQNPIDPYYYDLQAQAVKSVDLWLADHGMV